MAGRSVLLLGLLVPSAAAAETVTLEELFAAVDNDQSLQAVARLRAEAEDASAPLHTRAVGPGIGVDSRVIPGAESELEVTLSQSFPLGRARRARRDAQRAGANAMRADGAQQVVEHRFHVAHQFYTAMHHQERLQVLATRHRELAAAHAALQARLEAKDASDFEVERMGRELRQVALKQRREQVALDGALLQLGALVPDANGLTGVEGSLAPQTCPVEAPRSPRLVALEHQIDAAEHGRAAAGRGNAPELDTHVGWASVIGPDELAQGVVVGIGLRIPFWGYGDFAQDRAAAETQALSASKSMLEREIAGRTRRAAERCSRMTEIAAEAAASTAATEQLVARAAAGYAAAELSLLEFVDAQRALLEDRLDHLELVAEARAAELEWRYETGGWP